jgi:hypothetical protein
MFLNGSPPIPIELPCSADPVEIAWAAGLYEGEGTMFLSNGGHYPICAVAMTDKDVLDKFRAIVGMGNVCGPYKYVDNHTPIYRWKVGGWLRCQRITDLFWDHLGERRQDQINSVYQEA